MATIADALIVVTAALLTASVSSFCTPVIFLKNNIQQRTIPDKSATDISCFNTFSTTATHTIGRIASTTLGSFPFAYISSVFARTLDVSSSTIKPSPFFLALFDSHIR